jgi:hypothetical protein
MASSEWARARPRRVIGDRLEPYLAQGDGRTLARHRPTDVDVCLLVVGRLSIGEPSKLHIKRRFSAKTQNRFFEEGIDEGYRGESPLATGACEYAT